MSDETKTGTNVGAGVLLDSARVIQYRYIDFLDGLPDATWFEYRCTKCGQWVHDYPGCGHAPCDGIQTLAPAKRLCYRLPVSEVFP